MNTYHQNTGGFTAHRSAHIAHWIALGRVLLFSLACLIILPHTTEACNTPIPLTVSDIGTQSAEVSWFQSGQADSFDISFRKLPEAFPQSPQITGIFDSHYTLTGLDAGGLYEYRIRAHCNGNSSSWSQPRRFVTHLSNPSVCGMHLPLGDNNCRSQGDRFFIEVDSAPGDLLGADVFIAEVKAIVSHTWPADLTMILKNPAGAEMTLTADNGIGAHHYGDPNSEDCSATTTFSARACDPISDGSPPFIGNFIPEEPFTFLYDSSQATGNWELYICDKAPGDIGKLIYFEIVFEEMSCTPPEFGELILAEEDQLHFSFHNPPNCDSVLIEWGPKGFTPSELTDSLHPDARQVVIDCENSEYILTQLIPTVEYDLYLATFCGGDVSPFSCPVTLLTLCQSPTLSSDFKSEDVCAALCNEYCKLTGWWRNLPDSDYFWLVNEGPGPVEGTGPESAVDGTGRYLYYHSSGQDCQLDGAVTLQSHCLDIQAGTENCDLSFYYHMWGPHVNRLDLLISVDGGFQWDTLWTREGAQSEDWIQTHIDLSNYDGLTGRFKFIAQAAHGPLGDIGLDEILIYNSQLADSSSLLYFVDMDGDGYGVDGTETFFCTQSPPEGWADQGGDCNDNNPNIHPGAEVIPCNLIDENCTGLEDDQPEDNPMRDSLITIQHESCTAAVDGALEIEISGGHPPYSVVWNTGDSSHSLSGLKSGVYYATVTDDSGCLFRTAFYEIERLVEMNFLFTNAVQPSCLSSSDGELTVLTGGGSPPLNYLWNTGDTSSQISGLSAGSYRLTVTDAGGCTFESPTFHLDPATPFQIHLSEVQLPTCHGNSDGSLLVTATGGTAPYRFEWSTGDSTSLAENLSSGWYSVTVTDSTDCSAVKDSIFLAQPEVLEAFFPITSPPLCPGKSSGQIYTEVQGGSFPYTFFWQKDQQTYTTKDLLAIPAGTYHLTITDFNGCHLQTEINLQEPEPFKVETDTVVHETCGNRSDGEIRFSVSGGWQPYQLFWNTGSTDQNQLKELSAGDYQFTLTDQAGCKFTSAPIEISNLEQPLNVHLTILDSILCKGDKNGTMRARVESSHYPLLFNWSHKNPLLSEDSIYLASGLGPNNYSLSVSDASGCSGHSPVILLSEPPELFIGQLEVSTPSCYWTHDGSIVPFIVGGTPPYQFEWSHGSTAAVAEDLSAGTYALTVTDKNGCRKYQENIQIDPPPELLLAISTTDDVGGQGNGEAYLQITGGIPPYSVYWDPKIHQFTDSSASELEADTYSLSVEDANDCTIDTSFTIDLVNFTTDLSELKIELSPNPSSGRIYLSFSQNGAHENIQTRIINSAGREVRSRILNRETNRLEIEISEVVPDGYYTLVLHFTASGQKTALPFILQRP